MMQYPLLHAGAGITRFNFEEVEDF